MKLRNCDWFDIGLDVCIGILIAATVILFWMVISRM
jgi:hypothetical protein